MPHDIFANPALTVGFALAIGMVAQIIARHMRLPGIVLLLAAGVIAGPGLLGIVQPGILKAGLQHLVGFAVAVILFEGGMALNLKRLRREGKAIRQLVSLGAVVTAVGGTLAARYLLEWPWAPSILFGTLMIVTGPTVVTPLLRRIRVKRRVATILEAEGVFGDAIGAIIAVVALEVVTSDAALGLTHGLLSAATILGFGMLAGLIGGGIIATLLKIPRLIPEGLESITTLALVFALFQGADAVIHESGIAAAVFAGLVVGNVSHHASKELHEFKEQLTTLAIAMLFVLLAAMVKLEDIQSLGWPGVLTFLVLMFIVRPINILVGTYGTEVTRNEKLFMCWLAPRGIVAAAVSSVFATSLAERGMPHGSELQALVFLVIAASVIIQGLLGGVVAKRLGLTLPKDNGYVIVGGNALARAMGAPFLEAGEEVVIIDSDPLACQKSERAGFRVLHGSAGSERIQITAELNARKGVMAITRNDAANILFIKSIRKTFKVENTYAALNPNDHVRPPMLHEIRGKLLFDAEVEVDQWSTWLDRGRAQVEWWTVGTAEGEETLSDPWPYNQLLPMVIRNTKGQLPYADQPTLKKGNQLLVAILTAKRADAEAWLQARGATPLESTDSA